MKRLLAILISGFICLVLRGVPAESSVLKTFAGVPGGGGTPPRVGDNADLISLRPYSVRHGLTRHLYIPSYDTGAGDSVLRVDPYGKVDWLVTGLNGPVDDIWVDFDGTVLYTNWDNEAVDRVDLTGTVTRVAGNGTGGYSGDGGPAVDAQLYQPEGITTDDDGNIYVIGNSTYCVVRKIDRATGIISTVAGNAELGCGYSGDGGPATAAQLSTGRKIVVDRVGNLLIGDYGNSCIRKVDRNGIISTIAGNCTVPDFGGDGGPAAGALLNQPSGVDVDAWGNIYFSDRGNNRIRRIDKDGYIATVAGNGTVGCLDNLVDATQGNFSGPRGLSVDRDGHLYVADYGNSVIRRVVFNPAIGELSRTSGAPGTKVVISGRYFGSVMESSSVTLGTTALEATHWSNTELHVIIPPGARSGNIVVQAEGGDSNSVYFRVTR